MNERSPRSVRLLPLLALPITALLLAAAGCSTDDALPVREALTDAPKRAAPLPFRVAVAPLVVAEKATKHPTASYIYRRATAQHLGDVRPAVTAALDHAGAFEEVTFLEELKEHEAFVLIESDEDDDDDESAQGAGAKAKVARRAYSYPEAPTDLALGRAATAAKCDLLLKLTLNEHAINFDRINGKVAPSMIMLMLFWFPAYWIADETFVGTIDLELSLHEPGRRQAVWRDRVRVRARVELDDWDRGFTLLSTIGVPDWFDDDNYDCAAEHAMPHAHNAVALKVAEALTELESLPEP